MANRKIGAVIALDGEQQFKSAVTDCTRELNTMKSAMKLVEAQTDGQAKSLETLNKKHTCKKKGWIRLWKCSKRLMH